MSAWFRTLSSLSGSLVILLVLAGSGEAGVLDASWTAPTTNTDGSDLTDLLKYRVYYGTGASPCLGPTFVEVASPSATPPANQTVSVRLTGLVSGTTYNVAVTAIDAGGNQSACSTPASAVAQVDFTVSPTGMVSFGSVTVGSSTTRVFTVQGTRAGTVTGTATVPSPFSIVSGSPFNLSGTGSALVAVRFAPTSPVNANANLRFIADGDTITRLVTGIGVLVDLAPPSVSINAPTLNPTFLTTNPSLALGGTASDNVGVTQVTWASDRGGSGTAVGAASWTVAAVDLAAGPNVLTVTARDAANNFGTGTLTVTLMLFSDNPIASYSTLIKAAHLTELRTAVNGLRAARGLAAFPWTDPALAPGTLVRLIHVTELRAALDQAYQAAGRPLPVYTDQTLTAGMAVKGIHLGELRSAVGAP